MQARGATFRLLATTALLTLVFWQSGASSQSQLSSSDRSFYLNQPVDHPEALSGYWEAPDGRGGGVGIELALTTTLSSASRPRAWMPQSWYSLGIDVFEQTEAELKSAEMVHGNGFSDSARGGGLTYQNKRLQLHFVHMGEEPSIDLDLDLQSDGCWHGRFHRGAFDSAVALCRPTPGPGAAISPFVGTWLEAGGGTKCVHVAQAGPNSFLAWLDTDAGGFASGAPDSLGERFGDLLPASFSADGVVSLIFGPTMLCCPIEFIGRLSSDGTTIRGKYLPEPNNQYGGSSAFTKMPGDSCINPAAPAK